MGDSELFSFVPRSWQDKKHFSLYLYRAYTIFPILLQHLRHCETLSSKTQKMSIELSNTEIRILVSALK